VNDFPFNLYCLGGLGACLITVILTPIWIRLSRRLELTDHPGHRKIHHHPMPLAGGPAILSSLVCLILIGIICVSTEMLPSVVSGKLALALSDRGSQLTVLFCGATGMFLLGLIDDLHTLTPSIKFAGQVLAAAVTAFSGIQIELFIQSEIIQFLVTVLWILTLTNAFNFIDNMNGLCSGVAAICIWSLAWTASVSGQYLVAAFSFAVFGCFLGFLPFNFPKAKSFLGDSGSHLTGYLVAVLAVMSDYYSPFNRVSLSVLNPLLILSVPLIDLIWVVLIRFRLKKPFYIGDINHISHRLVRRGFSPRTTVLVIWLCGAASGTLSIYWPAFFQN
jgi:UDP-GlcNAc:undecaprenyl-phosphate GlcNAc-1-phosphate transferase